MKCKACLWKKLVTVFEWEKRWWGMVFANQWIKIRKCSRCKWTWEEKDNNLEPDNTKAWLWEDLTREWFIKYLINN